MTQSKHTPTPWKYQKYGTEKDANNSHEIFTDCDTEYYVGNVSRDNKDPEATAAHIVKCVNAHDELVAALEGMLLVDSVRSEEHKKSQGYQDAYVTKAFAALTKAKAGA